MIMLCNCKLIFNLQLNDKSSKFKSTKLSDSFIVCPQNGAFPAFNFLFKCCLLIFYGLSGSTLLINGPSFTSCQVPPFVTLVKPFCSKINLA